MEKNNKKKKGMKMPARVEKHVSAQQSAQTQEIVHTCTHWSNKRNRCKLGTVCSGEENCRAYHL